MPLDTRSAAADAAPVTVVPLPPSGAWLPDARGSERALRATWHPEAGCVVLSTWQDGRCTATARLAPGEAAQLVAVLAEGLAAATDGPVGSQPVEHCS